VLHALIDVKVPICGALTTQLNFEVKKMKQNLVSRVHECCQFVMLFIYIHLMLIVYSNHDWALLNFLFLADSPNIFFMIHCEWSGLFSLFFRLQYHSRYICLIFPHYTFKDVCEDADQPIFFCGLGLILIFRNGS